MDTLRFLDMIENVIKAVKFLCPMFKLDCSVSNAESFIFSIGEDGISRESQMLTRFEEIFDWGSVDLKSFYTPDKIGEDFLEHFSHQVGWKEISELPLSNEFMIRNRENLYWIGIARKQKLSEDMIELFGDKLDWKLVSFNQAMSEEFMEKHSSKLDWVNISLTKKLSRSFILKHEDKLNMNYVKMQNRDSIVSSVRGMY